MNAVAREEEGHHQCCRNLRRLSQASCWALRTLPSMRHVRKVINLVTSVKMPNPEGLTRNRAKTERVWLERGGTTTGCIILEERRWCYEQIPPEGNRAEMLRIRNEPSRGPFVGALFYYIVDFDLERLVYVGSTTEIDQLSGSRRAQIAEVIQFFHRGTSRGDGNFRPSTRRCTMRVFRLR